MNTPFKPESMGLESFKVIEQMEVLGGELAKKGVSFPSHSSSESLHLTVSNILQEKTISKVDVSPSFVKSAEEGLRLTAEQLAAEVSTWPYG